MNSVFKISLSIANTISRLIANTFGLFCQVMIKRFPNIGNRMISVHE